MASIKNLKSGRVPDTSNSNPTLPEAEVGLYFGQVDTKNLIQQQANKVIVITNASRAGTTTSGGHGGTKK